MAKLPLVAIVGRANVGKSSLFNRLVNQRQAIVADEPGTTRDAVYGRVETPKGSYGLVDTAGLKAPQDEFERSIQDQIADAADSADAIIVVVDATGIVSDEDRTVAKLAHRSGKPVVLALNKADGGKRVAVADFKKLGIKTMVPTSATQNQGLDELEAAVLPHIQLQTGRTDDDTLRLALIGRPNVGKSSLFNALAKKQQAIVADAAGTTRDVNRVALTYHGRSVELLDTAGIRKSGRVERGVEKFSVLRAVSAIEESDVCLLIIDANEAGVALDQKLAGMIKDAGKGVILTISKWDSVDKDAYTHDQLADRLRLDFQHVAWAPFIVTSAASGQNVTKLFELAAEIDERRRREIGTRELNQWLGECVHKHQPAGLKNRHPKLRYITQTGTRPPEFTIFGSQVRLLHWSYKRYLEKELRRRYDFTGTPLDLRFNEKEARK